MKEIRISKDDAVFIYNLIPQWAKEKAPEGLDPTFYGTLTKEGDDKVFERINKIFFDQKFGEGAPTPPSQGIQWGDEDMKAFAFWYHVYFDIIETQEQGLEHWKKHIRKPEGK